LGLLLRLAVHSAGRACARDRQDGYPDELFREAEEPVRHQADARPPEPNAWDASACARRDAAWGAADRRPDRRLVDVVEKLAAPERDAQAQDASLRR